MTTTTSHDQTAAPPPVSERNLLWLLALIQFTVIMDFMVMMPLGPQIMSAFAIGPAGFATAVSVYAWCSGLTGLLAATYIDRFDRRTLLLCVFTLFMLSNLACALADTFELLLFARAFAGFTGGVLGPIVMAVVGDVIPASRRGAAMGTVMTSFSIASIAGVPIGVALGAHYGWQSAFFLLAVFCVLIWLAALRVVPSLTAHLAASPPAVSEIVPRLVGLIIAPSHLGAFALVLALVISNMLIIPFISPVLVANLGIAPGDVAWIYVAGGVATLFTARMIGRLSDRYGKVHVFRAVALFSIAPMLVVTHLPRLPLAAIVAFFPFFMVAMSGRFIPLQALLTGVPEPAQRGAFMSIVTAMQSLGSGIGAWLGGLPLAGDANGAILGYGIDGWFAAALTLFAVIWIGFALRPPTPAPSAAVVAAGEE